MLIFVSMIRRDEGGDRATLRLWFSFRIDAYKTEIIMCDTTGLVPMLKLVRDLMKEKLRFQMGKVFSSQKVNLLSLEEY